VLLGTSDSKVLELDLSSANPTVRSTIVLPSSPHRISRHFVTASIAPTASASASSSSASSATSPKPSVADTLALTLICYGARSDSGFSVRLYVTFEVWFALLWLMRTTKRVP
jgi:hypothetical protein